MTKNNSFLSLTAAGDISACCEDIGFAGDLNGEITYNHLDSMTAAIQHYYGSLASSVLDRVVDSQGIPAIDKFYTQDQRELLPSEAACASAGCGNPLGVADAAPGEIVMDLGSGGGVDCFIAAKEVGDDGFVIGIDMTPRMLELARNNAEKLRTENVVFKLGHIESVPQPDDTVDLIISNCVIALSERKDRVFSEILRILKPGGRFVISDIVTSDTLPSYVQKSPSEWVDCVGGAAVMSEYIEMVREAGFPDIEILNKEQSRPYADDWQSNLINLTLRAYKPYG